ncbi:MAG: hypothetical protein HDR44_00565 [Allobaculum sp.]|nr:hypothetical protein [Allobaculum sp.]
MFNKKRLVMMVVAASMVLPTNLTYLSMITPILAAEEGENTSQTATTETIDFTSQNPTSTTFSIVDDDIVSGAQRKIIKLNNNATYTLASDIEINSSEGSQDGSLVVSPNYKVTIDLNGHKITSTTPYMCKIYSGGELTIIDSSAEKTGKLVSKTQGLGDTLKHGAILWILNNDQQNSSQAKLSVEGVTLESDVSINLHGIGIDQNCSEAAVTVTDTKIEVPKTVGSGVYVNGVQTATEKDQYPSISLTNSTINAPETTGIYQAGLSTITVNNGSITGNCGIETRAGDLNVTGTTVTGGNGAFDVKPEGNAATTENAGIAIAQHTTDKPITVTIDKATISGSVGLSITDPQNLQTDATDDSIKISVSNSTLSGDEYAVAYTEDTIKFDLIDTTLSKGEITKLDEVETKKNDKTIFSKNDDGTIKEVDTSETPKEDLPYEITTNPKPSGGGNKKPSKPKPEEPSEEPMTPVGTPTTMYRLYNNLTGEHLYTIDKNERDNLLTSDTWKDEGEGWIAPSVSDYPVYRLLNPNNGDHHYTTDKNEFDTLPSYGWVAEGVAFFSADKDNPENVLLHRLYNPNATGAGSHHYTADTNERDTLVEKGWTYEGLAWAGLPANK